MKKYSKEKYGNTLLQIEVFIPKRLTNLGKLVELLENMLDFRRAKEDLICRANEIFEQTEWGNEGIKNIKQAKNRIKQIEKCIHGYSIYEVDGAFETSCDMKTSKIRKSDVRICEERTMVVRMLAYADPTEEEKKDNVDFFNTRSVVDALLVANEYLAFKIASDVAEEDEIWVTASKVWSSIWKKHSDD